MMKKYHFIYRITNRLNDRFYIGMHSTDNINDGYFGSGKRLKFEIEKHGRENLIREILEFFPSRELLARREAELVNSETLINELCLNLKCGGEGGRGWSKEERSKGGKVAAKRLNAIFTAGSSFVNERNKRSAITFSKRCADGTIKMASFANKRHTEESKIKMRKPKNVGENNSQFGTCWVTDGLKPIKIKKEQLVEFLEKGFRQGRK